MYVLASVAGSDVLPSAPHSLNVPPTEGYLSDTLQFMSEQLEFHENTIREQNITMETMKVTIKC